MNSQHVFSRALLDGELPVPEQLLQPNGKPARQRFGVYRNNVISSLVEAMLVGFPVVSRLLGDEYFRALAAEFVRQHPPSSPVLSLYGGQFPDFLTQFEPLAGYPYLPDIAKLELGRRNSHNAADLSVTAAEQLAAIAPDLLMAAAPVAHPSLFLLRSRWPVHEIWASQQGDADNQKADMNVGAQTVMVVRPEMQVQQYLLQADQAHFVGAIDGNRNLGEIATEVLAVFPSCDFIQLMVLTIQQCAIASFVLPKEAP